MFTSSPRASPKMAALPRRLSSIMVSVVGMAMFLVFASLLLVSYPISSTVRGYFYGVDREVFVVSPVNQSTVETTPANNSDQGVSGANILDRILGVDSPNSTESNTKNNEAVDQSGSPVEKKEDNGNSASDDATKNASAESESSSKNNETVEKPGRSIEKEENNGNSASDNATKNTSDESESSPKNNETMEKPGGSIQNEENNGNSASDNATKNTSDESESRPKNNETVEKPGGSIQNEEKNSNSVSDNMAKNTSVESESSVKNNETKDQSAGSTENKENSGDSASNNATNNTSVESESSTKNNETKEQSAGSEENKENSGNSAPDNATKNTSVESECNLYHGTWFYDPLGPLYTNNSCPVLTQMQNCQGNGRPDKDYENWRWRPSGCELPRFDARKFLQLMSGKTLAFVGDSVARNQMESLLCLLWQVEAPKNRGNRKMQRWYFKSTNVMIVRIWSSWLVHQTSEKLDFAPEGVAKLHLDVPDETFMEFIPKFDVIVISSGHWFAKQSVYVLNNEIVGGQLWWPDKSRPMKVNNVQAFGISVETSLAAIATHPNFTGLAIVRSWSPDHYEGGAWNTGGSCTGKEKPLAPGELVENGFTDIMHKQQVEGYNRASQKVPDNSKMRLMDITEVFSYRHDGHPGPYRSPDPNKIVKRGPDGRPPPQDCLHWCMPGPVDTWNELVLEIIRRKFEGKQRLPS